MTQFPGVSRQLLRGSPEGKEEIAGRSESKKGRHGWNPLVHRTGVVTEGFVAWMVEVEHVFIAQVVGEAFPFVDRHTLKYVYEREGLNPLEAYAWCCNTPAVTH